MKGKTHLHILHPQTRPTDLRHVAASSERYIRQAKGDVWQVEKIVTKQSTNRTRTRERGTMSEENIICECVESGAPRLDGSGSTTDVLLRDGRGDLEAALRGPAHVPTGYQRRLVTLLASHHQNLHNTFQHTCQHVCSPVDSGVDTTAIRAGDACCTPHARELLARPLSNLFWSGHSAGVSSLGDGNKPAGIGGGFHGGGDDVVRERILGTS